MKFQTFEAIAEVKPMPKPEKRALTQDELEAIDCLSGVGMMPASWEKRFNRDVLQPAKETKLLSEKAVAQLWRLFIRYRRQWRHPERHRLLLYAASNAAPDFRKVEAARREQAEIDKAKAKYNFAINHGGG